MCDLSEEEWPEYLLQLAAAAARARIKVRPIPATSLLEGTVEPELATAGAGD